MGRALPQRLEPNAKRADVWRDRRIACIRLCADTMIGSDRVPTHENLDSLAGAFFECAGGEGDDDSMAEAAIRIMRLPGLDRIVRRTQRRNA